MRFFVTGAGGSVGSDILDGNNKQRAFMSTLAYSFLEKHLVEP